jgi:hypothetical protein
VEKEGIARGEGRGWRASVEKGARKGESRGFERDERV